MEILINSLDDNVGMLNYFYDYENEDYEKYKEIKNYLKQHKNNPNVYGYLSFMYSWGYGCKTNYKKAKKYATIGKKLNNPLSFTMLGDLYKYGFGVTINVKKYLKYYNRGAELNCPKAIHRIAKCYLDGTLALCDFKTAKKLLFKSIKLGFTDAYSSLSAVYYGEKNIKKHLKCNMILMINGNQFGYYQMGLYYCTKKNLRKAIRCFKKSKIISYPELECIYKTLGKFKKAARLVTKYQKY